MAGETTFIALAKKRRDSLLHNLLRIESSKGSVKASSPEKQALTSILDSNVKQPSMHKVQKAKFHRMFVPKANNTIETVSTSMLYPTTNPRPSPQKTTIIGKNAWTLNEEFN